MKELDEFFASVSKSVEETLEELIPPPDAAPKLLAQAIRWSIFAGGKRFRPVLLMAVGRTFDAPNKNLLRSAAAVEMLHTYSLIHDDLPAMDDDDIRRGRPTCHRKFGESTAILAGDALQALAFQTIAEDANLSVDIRLELLAGLGKAAREMVAGQQMDLEAEGRETSIAELEAIHRRKTGALIQFSAEAGAWIGNADGHESEAISRYASALGLLFQITDDLLDITQSTKTLGKTAAKDVTAKKATYPAVHGIDNTKRLADEIFHEAIGELKSLARPSEILAEIAEFLRARTF